MGKETKIQWCDATFSPWWGCYKLSPACDNCYAERMAKRYGFNIWGAGTGISRRHFGNKHWNEPLLWNKKAANEGRRMRVFCGSMCDVFEDKSSLDEERAKLWNLITLTPNLDWLLLTKRPYCIDRLVPDSWRLHWPANAHVGVTVEDAIWANKRIPDLLKVPARIRFISIEPFLGPIDLRPYLFCRNCLRRAFENQKFIACRCGSYKAAISWVIIGGESGPKARMMNLPAMMDLIRICSAAKVSIFVKQLGTVWAHNHKSKSMKGDDPHEWPRDFRIRQFPDF